MDEYMRILRQASRYGYGSFLRLAGIFVLFCASPAFSQDMPPGGGSPPVATDSRIKTFIYSENDVYNIVTHYGYQCNIEFGLQEEIQTISIGDRVPFQVIPAGRRLFIRAMTANSRTNMTIVTNKHAYQFDVASVPAPVMPNEELVYVVRFFYPTVDNRSFMAPRDSNTMPKAYNYKYTYTGSDEITPLKVFDDGRSTYFKLRNAVGTPPDVFAVDDTGREVSVVSHASGEYLVVDVVSPRFDIRSGDYMVMIYNEKFAH